MARIVWALLIGTLAAGAVGCAGAQSADDTTMSGVRREAEVVAPALRAAMAHGGGTAAAFREAAEAAGLPAGAAGVPVDVQTRGLTAADRARFALDGVTVRHFSPGGQRMAAVVRDAQALRALARLPQVRYIAPAYGPAVSDE